MAVENAMLAARDNTRGLYQTSKTLKIFTKCLQSIGEGYFLRIIEIQTPV
ncbi:hypothetical protein [Salinimonas lutimaris]|nr:hypothetical protein [Salinimonas lutimaris]